MKFILALTFLITTSAFAQLMGAGSSSGVGNPAAVFCKKIGGKSSIVETPAGQAGVCKIEEWKLYRTFIKRNVDPAPYIGSIGNGGANPASLLCKGLDGEHEIVDTRGGQIGVCALDDWHLFRVLHPLN